MRFVCSISFVYLVSLQRLPPPHCMSELASSFTISLTYFFFALGRCVLGLCCCCVMALILSKSYATIITHQNFLHLLWGACVKIIPITEKDYSSVAMIFNEAIKSFIRIYNAEERSRFTIHENVDSVREMTTSRILLGAIREDDKLKGYIAFRKKNTQVVWISSLYVEPESQKQGIGTLLLEAAMDFAQRERCRCVALETHEKADWAISFYSRRDFKIVNDILNDTVYFGLFEQPIAVNRPLLVRLLIG